MIQIGHPLINPAARSAPERHAQKSLNSWPQGIFEFISINAGEVYACMAFYAATYVYSGYAFHFFTLN